MQPASALIIPNDLSNPIIRFMRPILRMTSSCTGTDPPTKPVLPPWGTTASLIRLQCFKIRETYSVVSGLTTTLLDPIHFLVQSVLKDLTSLSSVKTDLHTFLKKVTSESLTVAKLGFLGTHPKRNLFSLIILIIYSLYDRHLNLNWCKHLDLFIQWRYFLFLLHLGRILRAQHWKSPAFPRLPVDHLHASFGDLLANLHFDFSWYWAYNHVSRDDHCDDNNCWYIVFSRPLDVLLLVP